MKVSKIEPDSKSINDLNLVNTVVRRMNLENSVKIDISNIDLLQVKKAMKELTTRGYDSFINLYYLIVTKK